MAAASAFADALIFDCSYSVSSFSLQSSVYTCSARVLIFSATDNVLYAVTQNHLSSKSNADVNGLQIVNERLPSFPRNIENFYSNLTVIFFRNNSLSHISGKLDFRLVFRRSDCLKLTHVSADDLLPFPSLVHLTLWDNKIQVLGENVFSRTPKLLHIDFDNNQLIHTARNVLDPLENLTNAFFSNNVCISKSVSSIAAVASLKFELAQKCPPTLEMFLADVLNREYFKDKVVEIIKNSTASLTERVRILEEKVEPTAVAA